MSKLPERFAHLERREGVVPYSVLTIDDVRNALRRTLPTRHHARLFFDAALRELGARAHVDDTRAPHQLSLHVRDADRPALIVGAPLVRLARGPGQSVEVMRLVMRDGITRDDAPEGWKPGDPPWRKGDPRPEIVPRGPEMCGGALRIAEGHGAFEIDYDAEGIRAGGAETGGDDFVWLRHPGSGPYHLDTLARPPSRRPISLLARPGLRPEGHAPDELAALVAPTEIASRVGWRVHLPVPVPAPIEELVAIARSALRPALFSGEVPEDARWVAADGIEGKAIAWGATVEETLAAFERAVFAKKPKVPAGPAPAPEGGEGTLEVTRRGDPEADEGDAPTYSTGELQITLTSPPPRFAWPRPIPANVPAVLLELGEVPAVPERLARAGFARAARVVGEHGALGHVFVRDDATGHLGIGEHVVDLIDDPSALERELDRADAEMEEVRRASAHPGDELLVERRAVYVVFDDGKRARIPARPGGASMSAKLGPPDYDGDVAPWRVVRERRPG